MLPCMQKIPDATNRLLAALPQTDRQRLASSLTPVSLRSGEVIQRRLAPLQKVYFLHGGLCSIAAAMADGQQIEIASVGNDGLIGIKALLGVEAADETEATMLVGGDADWISVEAFRHEVSLQGAVLAAVRRYLHRYVADLETSVACNALHPVEKRLARWLLQAQNRLGNDLPLTHDTLATVLGVRRASVTLAATALHRSGVIDYGHKRISVRDRRGLEISACECYRPAHT